MSTPTPTTPAPKGDAPFDPHAFPSDLLDAQRELDGLYAALRAYQATLPWAREAHPGWEAEKERGRQERQGREETAGWGDEPAAMYDGLLRDIREKAEVVHCHSWWQRCRDEGFMGAAQVDARQALKQAAAAIPLGRGDVDKAA
jgi:hypothetical protein